MIPEAALRFLDPEPYPLTGPGAEFLDICFLAENTILHSTLKASGTTPPVATLTGGVKPYGFRVEITSTGTLAAGVGTALYRWSRDNGSTWVEQNLTIQSTKILVGTGGWKLNFPDGTYTSDNVYRATARSISNSRYGGLSLNTNSGAPEFIQNMRSGLGGIRFLEANLDSMTLQSGLINGTNQSFCIFCVFRIATLNAAGRDVYGFIGTDYWDFGGNTSIWVTGRKIGANPYQQRSSTIPIDTSWHASTLLRSATQIYMKLDNVSTNLFTSNDDDSATISASTFSLARSGLTSVYTDLDFQGLVGYRGGLVEDVLPANSLGVQQGYGGKEQAIYQWVKSRYLL